VSPIKIIDRNVGEVKIRYGQAKERCQERMALLAGVQGLTKRTLSIMFGTPLAGWVDFKGFWLD